MMGMKREPTVRESTPASGEILDPWKQCTRVCTHDLARGVRVTDLLGGDGPNDHSLMVPYWWPTRAVSS